MSWKKVKLGDIFNIEKGILQSSKCIPGNFTFITAAETWKTHITYSHDCEALIFAAAASGSLGRTHYVKGKFISSDLCFILTEKDKKKYPLDLRFYHFVFNSFKEIIVKATKTGTSKEAINFKNFYNYEISYFEIEQQHVWIDKLIHADSIKDKLLIELDQQQTYLQLLRQTILQEAVQGKLTKQDANDEPATELLKRIKAEKQKLIKAGKLKKEKELSRITEDEIPFELPEGWVWCRFQEITTLITDGKHGDSPNELNSGYYFLSAKDVKDGKLNYDYARQITYDGFIETHKRTDLKPGDICLVNTGATIGKIAIADDNELTERTTFQKSVAVIKMLEQFVLVHYVEMFLRGSVSHLIKTSGGSAINNLLLGDLKQLLIPLPPLAEQQRIVAKVEQLQQQLGQLETQVKQSWEYAQQLLQSVLREAFEEKGKVYKMGEEKVGMVAEE